MCLEGLLLIYGEGKSEIRPFVLNIVRSVAYSSRHRSPKNKAHRLISQNNNAAWISDSGQIMVGECLGPALSEAAFKP